MGITMGPSFSGTKPIEASNTWESEETNSIILRKLYQEYVTKPDTCCMIKANWFLKKMKLATWIWSANLGFPPVFWMVNHLFFQPPSSCFRVGHWDISPRCRQGEGSLLFQKDVELTHHVSIIVMFQTGIPPWVVQIFVYPFIPGEYDLWNLWVWLSSCTATEAAVSGGGDCLKVRVTL